MDGIRIILLLYFGLMTFIGIYSWFRVRNVSDYYISGKKGSWWQITGSLFATVIGGSAILGTIELSQKAGWAAFWFLGSASVGLFVLAGITGRVSKLGHYTLPEMMNQFYGRRVERTASLLIPVAWLGIIAVQIIAGAKILASLPVMGYQQGAFLCCGVFVIYTILGGQKSILKTDFIQALIIIAGLVTLFLLTLRNIHSAASPLPSPGGLFNENFSGIDLFFLLVTYSVTFVVGPDIYSRIFCAKDEKTARRSVLLVAILLLPVAFLLTFLGITAADGPGAMNDGGFILPGTSFLPPWALGLLAASLLSAVMSSADTTLLTSATILTELFTGNLDKKGSLTLTRLFIVVLGLASLGIAIKVNSILNALLFSLTFFSGAFILPVIAGIAGWKVNPENVFPAMAAGGTLALAGKIIQQVGEGYWGYSLIFLAFVLNGSILFFPRKISFSRKQK